MKFKDADLIGIPIRLVISPKLLKDRKAGLKRRADKEEITVGINEVIPAIEAMLKEPFDLR